MIARLNPRLLSLLAMAMIMALGAMAPTTASAQELCECPTGLISVDHDDEGVPAEICLQTDAGMTCYSVVPGTELTFPCEGSLFVYVIDENGNLVHIPFGVHKIIRIRPFGWCVYIEIKRHAPNCIYIRIRIKKWL